MQKHIFVLFILGIPVLFSVTSCKKFLDAKSVQTLTIPEKLSDLEAILDNYSDLNLGVIYPHTNTDEIFVEFNDWQSLYEPYGQSYIWAAAAETLDDWRNLYKTVFNANTVLDNLENIEVKGLEPRANAIKGAALFHRARAFYDILQMYSPAYKENDEQEKWGIPLRLEADFNIPSERASVTESYNQVIKDINDAVDYLPAIQTLKNRPSKASCYALLARTYLQIGKYEQALNAANACLEITDALIDYNSTADVDTLAASPFKFFNAEVLYYTTQGNPITVAKINPELFNSYDVDDIRRAAFFGANPDGSYYYRGSYNGDSYQLFSGLTTSEVYLVRAESFARLGDISSSLDDLNALLEKRWKAGTFVALNISSPDELLETIIMERRKELVGRGIRWADIKRLNTDPATQVTLTREFGNGETYTLTPNDLRYAYLIPIEVMQNSSLEQNPR